MTLNVHVALRLYTPIFVYEAPLFGVNHFAADGTVDRLCFLKKHVPSMAQYNPVPAAATGGAHPNPYSVRSAIIGSTCTALQAGTTDAAKPAATRRAVAIPSMTGSQGDTPNN